MPNLPWEDTLLERKVESDLKDLLKTLVAFANSVKPGHTAILLIGEKNDGSIQGVKNPENIQRNVRETATKIYPPILYKSYVYEKEGKTCVRVEIEYSADTPHFGGAAWVRRGSETKEASDEVFQKLIEFRLGKVRELAMWVDKDVIVEPDTGTLMDGRVGENYMAIPRLSPKIRGPVKATLLFVNNFWVTFKFNERHYSEPLEKIILSWADDHKSLKLLIKP
jgi:hypothetical protein